MCGIAGQIRFDGASPDKRAIGAMKDALLHRGPDDQGVAIDGPAGLASCRLAFQDLSKAGHMPMDDAGGRYRIVFNGEIYNFLELRGALEADGVSFKSRSDTEVILELYRREGSAMLAKLRGMFAIAIWDGQEKELFLARDRFGKKPLKYWHDGTRFVFASELKAILADTTIPRDVDWSAIDEYLAYHYVPAPRTGFKGIYKLPPATWMLVKKDGAMTQETYWHLAFEPKRDQSEKAWMAGTDEMLRTSVEMRLISDVPVGAHLSGGIDSSLVVSYMADLMNEPVQTFSMGFSQHDYDERPFARAVARRYRTDHHEFLTKPQDLVSLVDQLALAYEEPYADSSALPSWLLAEQTRSFVKVALNGDGGDEMFGGYRRYQGMRMHALARSLRLEKLLPPFNLSPLFKALGTGTGDRAQRFVKTLGMEPAEAFRSMVGLFDDAERQALCDASLLEKMRGSRAKTLIADAWHDAYARDVMDQVYATDIATSLADGLLPKVDIASMAHSMELRSPFLDQELAALAASMPSSLKTTRNDTKVLLKKIARQRLPVECIDRPKQGFSVPLEHWFRDDLASYIRHEVTDPAFLAVGFRKLEIERILSEHESGTMRHDQRLWTLLMLKRWLVGYGLLG